MRDNKKWLAVLGPLLGFFILYYVLGAGVGEFNSRLSELRDYGPATMSEVQALEAEDTDEGDHDDANEESEEASHDEDAEEDSEESESD